MAERRRGAPRTNDRIERLAALFLLGCVAFNPPLLRVFGAPYTVLGLPLLYVYIFAVWLALIVLMALALERRGRRGRHPAGHPNPEPGDGSGEHPEG